MLEQKTPNRSLYSRYKILTSEAPPRVPKPYPFKPIISKVGLAKILISETFHLNFKLLKNDYRKLIMSRPCLYGVFDGPFGGFFPIEEKCTGCMRCVQEFPNVCDVIRNPGFNDFTDSYWMSKDLTNAVTSPYHIVISEAGNGKIPVKGMGYRGSFSDQGWDTIWTDMSEIIRPTRDGIYGREFISTVAHIGSRISQVDFERELDPSFEIPIPIIFDKLPSQMENQSIIESIQKSSAELGTMYIDESSPNSEYNKNLILKINAVPNEEQIRLNPTCIEIDYNEFSSKKLSISQTVENFKSKTSSIILIRMKFNKGLIEQVKTLLDLEIDGFHFISDYHGQSFDDKPRFAIENIREIHRFLVEQGIRDKFTLIVGGGIILAEHVPKAIICGADLVSIETSALVALQMKFDGECRIPEKSKMILDKFDENWGRQRLVNLIGAWYNQILEVLSAMGMRDIRRLRGDTGRAIFKSEIEKEAFAGIRRVPK